MSSAGILVVEAMLNSRQRERQTLPKMSKDNLGSGNSSKIPEHMRRSAWVEVVWPKPHADPSSPSYP